MDTQVIVVGAGPVGLILAGELRLGGAEVIVVEQRPEPITESRASTLHARTMEIFDSRGLLDGLGVPPSERRGHFGGIPLDLTVSSRFPGQWKVPQPRLEALLTEWIVGLGADIRRGWSVLDLADHGGGVEITARTPDGVQTLSGVFVVGCDGTDSAVRRLVGAEFPGRLAQRELLRADVAGIDIPNRRFERLPVGLAIAARNPQGVTRVMVHEFGRAVGVRTAEPDFAEVADVWRRVTGEDISGGTPLWVNAFDDENRQLAAYRHGRVLLAGDAAHRKLPSGGQAVNLGLQDAVNLGWKLAGVVSGWAPEDLLDSYDRERHEVGARVLENIRAQAFLLLGDAEVEPLRALMGQLMGTEQNRVRLAETIAGLDVRYETGEHPLSGRRIPDVALLTPDGPVTTTALLRSGRGLLIDLTDRKLAELAEPWSDRVTSVTARVGPGAPLAGAVLVRPDGYIAWIGSNPTDALAALRRWFGRPTTGLPMTKGRAMDTDVIVVGAGPTGLMLAGELRIGGARVIVAEQLDKPTGQSRGLGFTARAMETFDQRGLLPRFGTVETSPMGHFGGVIFDYTVLEDGHFGARGIPQSKVEEMLESWAGDLGADIRRGWEVLDLTDHGDAVEVSMSTPEGVRTLRASYLVGCDGGHSTVRKLVGFDFPGTPATRGMFLADVVGCELKPRPLGERLPNGMIMAAPLAPGVDRIIVCEHGTPAGDREATFDEIADAWERITGESIAGGGADWVSSFTDATRQVTEYRRGRVLLAGDAAHIHLPAGGQGLSVGVQDAANLGWKLAAVISGWAPEDLLDTYHGERHPVGERLLWNTRAQGTVFLGGEESNPLRLLFTELIDHDIVKRHLAGIQSGLDIRYPFGNGEHPLLGKRLPPRTLLTPQSPMSTFELLHAGQGVLLDLADDARLRAAANGWKDRVAVTTATSETPGALGDSAAILVRPDGYVAWAGDEPDGLAAALRRWFGAPLVG